MNARTTARDVPALRRRRVARSACLSLLAVAAAVYARPSHAQDMDACIKANEEAVALRRREKLLWSRTSLSKCASSTCPDVVRVSCQQRLIETNGAIPSVVLSAKDPAGHDIAGATVTIDGAGDAVHLDGSAIELDPGEHEFKVEAAGQPPTTLRLVLRQGEKNRPSDVVLGSATATPGPPSLSPSPVKAPSGTTAAVPAPPPDEPGTSPMRTTGWAVGGVGVASLAAGALFAGLSSAAHSSYERDCGSNIGAPANQCTSAGVSGEHDAALKGTLATAFFIGGGALVAASVVLVLAAPHGPSSGPSTGKAAEHRLVSSASIGMSQGRFFFGAEF